MDGVIAQRRTRRIGVLDVRERGALALLAGSFVAASALLVAALDTNRHPSLLVVALYVVLYALLSQVEFEIGSGAAIPTQLVLVPMLFVLPLSWVPPAIAIASLLRAGADVGRGRRRISRLPLALVNSWYAIGPVLVLAAAGATNPRWTAAPVYLATLATQFAIDLAVARIWARSVGSRAAPLRRHGLSFVVDASLAPIGLLVAFAAVGRPYLILLVLPLVGLLSLFARERGHRIDAALELGHAYRGTALLLGDVVEADDAYTGEHSRDVVSLTIEVAARLGLDARQARNAEFVALLHDVGKIRIPAQIINKPGPLDEDERRIIETHTVEGEAMLARVGGLLGEIGQLVRSCHEHWDGSGYPDRLAGKQIPLIARIVCCADAFSAMTTDRPYRKALSVDEAVVELRRCAGTQFDPRVVEAVVAGARR
jgi:HD-GYP domain-containing protein (c-di-GMP phosphodiesterase class II)